MTPDPALLLIASRCARSGTMPDGGHHSPRELRHLEDTTELPQPMDILQSVWSPIAEALGVLFHTNAVLTGNESPEFCQYKNNWSLLC